MQNDRIRVTGEGEDLEVYFDGELVYTTKSASPKVSLLYLSNRMFAEGKKDIQENIRKVLGIDDI